MRPLLVGRPQGGYALKSTHLTLRLFLRTKNPSPLPCDRWPQHERLTLTHPPCAGKQLARSLLRSAKHIMLLRRRVGTQHRGGICGLHYFPSYKESAARTASSSESKMLMASSRRVIWKMLR